MLLDLLVRQAPLVPQVQLAQVERKGQTVLLVLQDPQVLLVQEVVLVLQVLLDQLVQMVQTVVLALQDLQVRLVLLAVQVLPALLVQVAQQDLLVLKAHRESSVEHHSNTTLAQLLRLETQEQGR